MGAKMCGAKEILLKSWKKPHNLRTIPVTPKILEKNVTICGQSPGPLEILEKTSQSEPHPSPRPRDPWKSWKKPHNLRIIITSSSESTLWTPGVSWGVWPTLNVQGLPCVQFANIALAGSPWLAPVQISNTSSSWKRLV